MSGKLSPHNVEMPSISPLQVCPSVVGVPTPPFDPSPKDAFSSSFEVEDVVFFSVPLIPFFYFFRRHCDIVLFNPSSHFVKDHVLFVLIHLTGVSCPLLKFFSPYLVLYHFSTGVLFEFGLP